MIDVKSQLLKDEARLDALNGKTLSPKDWIQELASQVWALNQICLQQQEEIEKLNVKLNALGGVNKPTH